MNVIDHTQGRMCGYAKNPSSKCICAGHVLQCAARKGPCPTKDVEEIPSNVINMSDRIKKEGDLVTAEELAAARV